MKRKPVKWRKDHNWIDRPLRKRLHAGGEGCAVCRRAIYKDTSYLDGGNGNLVHPKCVGITRTMLMDAIGRH